ncbi:hypothetical protein GQ44DRAFT_743195 [Phaeosphaeriaceae sp. PMI808]|nr:hypothetical protein GQ44DRAFT_743195 [Phaeosphaeriaceae sp. PMI808]
MLWSHSAPDQLSDTETREDSAQSGGSILSSIFGQGLLQKGVRGLTEALSSGASNVPPGLGNISNSCYQNSVIQGLAALPPLRQYLSTMTAEHPSFTSETTNGALHELLTKLNNPKNQGQNFWIRGKLKSMSTFTQQDAQEYYSKVLDELDKEVKKASNTRTQASASWVEAAKSLDGSLTVGKGQKVTEDHKVERKQSSSRNIAPNPLDGLIAQRVGCTTCGYSEGLSLITFNCITVSLGNHYGYDIRECLDEYTKLEYIDGVECAKCTLLKLQMTLTPLAAAKPGSSFDTKLLTVTEMIDDEKFDDNTLVKTLNIPKKNWVQSSKSKQIVVARSPKLLVLHVNRSIFDERTGAQYKNTANVSYPSILDLGNWCLGNSPSGSRQPDMPLEEWPRDPTRSMLQESNKATTASPFQYRLRAAVTHFGSHGNGHYVCYRPYAGAVSPSEQDGDHDHKEATEQWWRFSDDNVYAVSEDQAHQGSVFMLFYERLDAPISSAGLETEPVVDKIPLPDTAPLPPQDIQNRTRQITDDEIAASIPLPDETEFLEYTTPSPLIPQPPTPETPLRSESDANTLAHPYPTPPPEDLQASPLIPISQHSTTKLSETEEESEDDSSNQFTSDSEVEIESPPTPKPVMRVPPPLMRSAGNKVLRGQGSRQSLALVPAT